MKKCIAVLMVFLLLLAFVLAVGAAEAENGAVEVGEDVAAPVDGGVEETPTDENYASDNWFATAKAWVGEHFSGIVVALSAIYAVFPKWGGLWVVLRYIKKAAAMFAALKTYMDDANNENSLYNVLKRQGNSISQFMNDVAPALEALRQDKEVTVKLTATLEGALARVGKMGGALGAVEEALELMASEFSDLISISTTVSAKQKAQMEADWMAKIEHLRNTVKEAAYVEQGEKENA